MVGEQDERGDDLDAVDRERERVRVPPGLAVIFGKLAHVTVADSSGDPGQGAHRRDGRAADPAVFPGTFRCRQGSAGRGEPGYFAALTARDLRKRTGRRSPSTRIIWFAWWDLRPTQFPSS